MPTAEPKKVKRSQFAVFLNTAPASTASYAILGLGVNAGDWETGKKVEKETFIHEDTARTDVGGEEGSMSITQKAYAGDPVFDFIDDLRISHASGSDCETDILKVYYYKTSGSGNSTYVAEKQPVAIEVGKFGGAGGETVALDYTIHSNGDPIPGTVTLSNGVPTFTADS